MPRLRTRTEMILVTRMLAVPAGPEQEQRLNASQAEKSILEPKKEGGFSSTVRQDIHTHTYPYSYKKDKEKYHTQK